MVGDLGNLNGCNLFCRCCLSRIKGGTSVRGCHSYRNYSCGRFNCIEKKECFGRKCNYTEYWCLLGSCGCRSHFHPSCYLYSTGKISRNKCFVLKNIHCITFGWCTWHLIPYSFSQILCERHAW